MSKPKAVMSWSSGKDSAFALAAARAAGEFDIVGLVSSYNEVFDRIAVHGTRQDIARAQADALNLPLIDVPLPHPCSNEIYEARMTQTVLKLKEEGITDWIFGDLFLEDVRAYRENLYNPHGITLHLPLWARDTTQLADEMLESGLETYIVTLDPRKLPKKLCGEKFDADLLARLPEDIDPCGENGEFHTVVANAPGFSAPLDLVRGETVERSGFIYTDFTLR